MVLMTVIYALCYVAIKAGLPFVPPLRFAGLRALAGGLLMLGLLVALKRPLLPRPQDWRWVVGLGITSTTIAFAAMFLSPGLAGAGIASVLGNSQPIFAVALAVPLLGERMTAGKQAALVLGAVGVILIALPSIATPGAYGIAGPALALGASVSLAIGSVIAKRMGPNVDLFGVTAWQLIAGSLPLLVVSGVAEHGPWMSVDPRSWHSRVSGDRRDCAADAALVLAAARRRSRTTQPVSLPGARVGRASCRSRIWRAGSRSRGGGDRGHRRRDWSRCL